MKNKILTTILTFTFLLGECQEMPWKIKEEQAKDDEHRQRCLILAVICEQGVSPQSEDDMRCTAQYANCTGNWNIIY